MKRFKAMDCPICGEFHFSGPNKSLSKEGLEEELANYERGAHYCFHCGWIYDLFQAENPDSHDGHNIMSLNEYREWFKAKTAENANYDWWEENKPASTPHKCPVCGEYEFEDESCNDICPVCGWQDDRMEEIDPDAWSACGKTFNEAVEDFKAKRAANPDYRKDKLKR